MISSDMEKMNRIRPVFSNMGSNRKSKSLSIWCLLKTKRATITDIILSKENRKDIEEIKPDYIKGLTFHYIEEMAEIKTLALLDEKVNDPIIFS